MTMATWIRPRLIVGLALLLAVTALLFYRLDQQERASQQVAETYGAIHLIQHLQATLSEVEEGLHGYLLSGNPSYLHPYRRALPLLPQELQRLREATAYSADQQQRVISLEWLLEKKLDEMRRLIAARQAGGGARLEGLSEDGEKRLIDDVRGVLRSLEDEERWRLSVYLAEHRRSSRAIFLALVVATALAWGVVLTAMARARRHEQGRQRAEQALKEREARLALALQAAQLETWEVDLRTERVVESGGLGRLLGLPPTAQVERLGDLLARLHAKDRDRVAHEVQLALEGRHEGEITFRVVQPDGSFRWIVSRAIVLRDVVGRPIRAIGVASDISERRQMQEQIQQSAKLASIGQLAAGVAHEINNPLNNITLFAGNLLDALERGPLASATARGPLQMMLQEARKASRIVEHLRSFGRRGGTIHEPVRLHAILMRALSLLEEPLRLAEIEVVQSWAEPEPIVSGDAIKLEQVFLNLLTNARDAVLAAPEKVLTITTAVTEDSVTVTIKDTGVGIPEEVLQRIFDPFYTTKPVGQGTGLGLSITYGIVKEHQGDIQVDSRPGEGAAFHVRIPLAKTEGPAARRVPEAQATTGG